MRKIHRPAAVVGVIVLGAGLLAGCSKPTEVTQTAAFADTAVKAEAAKSAPAPALATPSAPAVLQALLAYTYRTQINAPPKAIPKLLSGHQAACEAAVGGQCQVVTANLSTGEPEVAGTLVLRATPVWLGGFRTSLEAGVAQAGGKIAKSEASSEDLTRQIVDTEAYLRAKTTLRDRLQGLLENRPGKLSELLELEQALAQAQGELDAAKSELEVMRQRVATSTLTLSYQSNAPPRTSNTAIAQATADAGALSSEAIAMIIRAGAVLWPIGLLGLLAAAVVRPLVNRSRRPRPGASPPR